jgi:hypothetical protein
VARLQFSINDNDAAIAAANILRTQGSNPYHVLLIAFSQDIIDASGAIADNADSYIVLNNVPDTLEFIRSKSCQ